MCTHPANGRLSVVLIERFQDLLFAFHRQPIPTGLEFPESRTGDLRFLGLLSEFLLELLYLKVKFLDLAFETSLSKASLLFLRFLRLLHNLFVFFGLR